jgi:hypothetical protein
MDIQLIYTSLAERALSDAELDELLESSATFNARMNITGLLLYGDGKFMQVLEGEADSVDALMQNIKADTRHREINVLVRGPIKKRDFNEWAMGFHRTDRDSIGDMAHFVAFFEEEFDPDALSDHASLALSVLKSFAYPRSLDE